MPGLGIGSRLSSMLCINPNVQAKKSNSTKIYNSLSYFDFKRMRSALLPEASPDWTDIPCDLLRYIAGKTNSISDSLRMSAICRSWQTSIEKPKFPVCLMLAENKDNSTRCFCTASEDKVMERDLPEIRGRRCWGTPFGWLLTFGLDLELNLFNPLSRACFRLPSQCTFNTFGFDHDLRDTSPNYFRRAFIQRFSLSSSPTSPDCIVMVIYSCTELLAYARPGDQAWTPIDVDFACLLEDVIYFNGSFFAVHNHGHLLICQDLDGPSPKAVEFAKSPPFKSYPRKYIVDLGGYLCMIARIRAEYERINEAGEVEIETMILTEEFEIYKLDVQTRNWERILSLGDRSLFLGNCSTFSVLAADYPGCTANGIYFTDDESLLYETAGGIDTGFYNCDNKDNKVLVRLPVSDEEDEEERGFRSKFCPPLWILPKSH